MYELFIIATTIVTIYVLPKVYNKIRVKTREYVKNYIKQITLEYLKEISK
jgi:hypothetical protein